MDHRDYERMQRVWAAKLRESGFEDIERPGGQLVRPGSDTARRIQTAELGTEEYYRLARGWYWRITVARIAEIWLKHAEGWDAPQIAEWAGESIRTIKSVIAAQRSLMLGAWREGEFE